MFKPFHFYKAIAPLAISAAVAMPFAFMAASAEAAPTPTATTSFGVSANVTASCNVTATDLSFGTYDTAATDDNTKTSQVKVNCTKGTPFTVSLDAGEHASGAFADRAMSGSTSSDLLKYQLYTASASPQTVWGDATGTTATVAGTGAGPGAANEQDSTVYGTIAAGQNVSADSYTDTVNVSVAY